MRKGSAAEQVALQARLVRVITKSIAKYLGYESEWEPCLSVRHMDSHVEIRFVFPSYANLPSYEVTIREVT